jgi:hypothetical protein
MAKKMRFFMDMGKGLRMVGAYTPGAVGRFKQSVMSISRKCWWQQG